MVGILYFMGGLTGLIKFADSFYGDLMGVVDVFKRRILNQV